MFGTRSQGKVYNFVHADEIWKDHVIRELQSQKKWTEQWGYLLEEYAKLEEGLLTIGTEPVADKQQLMDEQAHKDLIKNEIKRELAADTTNERREIITDCKIDPITGPLGRHMQNNARGKNDIVKVLKWPREGLE